MKIKSDQRTDFLNLNPTFLLAMNKEVWKYFKA